MPTRVYAVGTAEATPTVIPSNPQRTVLVVQNLDTVAGTDYLYLSDQKGNVVATGIRIAPVGGSITLRRTHGEEPEKTWFLVAATAACPVRVMELYGEPTVIVERKPDEPSPQDPTAKRNADAPRMPGYRAIPTGYR